MLFLLQDHKLITTKHSLRERGKTNVTVYYIREEGQGQC